MIKRLILYAVIYVFLPVAVADLFLKVDYDHWRFLFLSVMAPFIGWLASLLVYARWRNRGAYAWANVALMASGGFLFLKIIGTLLVGVMILYHLSLPTLILVLFAISELMVALIITILDFVDVF
jgi:hypothetical protein